MKTPTLEEVVKYFENAKEVECLSDGESVDISKDVRKPIHKWQDCFWVDLNNYKSISVELWKPTEGYAKILSYKEPKEKTYKIKQETGMDSITINDVKYIKEDKDSFKITREQILSLKNTLIKEDSDELLKTIFPEVFETKLIVGKWYKFRSGTLAFYQGKNKESYGFHGSGKYFEKHFWFADYNLIGIEREATTQEVTEALTKECERLGIKEGVYCKSTELKNEFICTGYFYFRHGILYCDGNSVFAHGKFAEIIPTLTIQEAEAKLKQLGVNAKIV